MRGLLSALAVTLLVAACFACGASFVGGATEGRDPTPVKCGNGNSCPEGTYCSHGACATDFSGLARDAGADR